MRLVRPLMALVELGEQGATPLVLEVGVLVDDDAAELRPLAEEGRAVALERHGQAERLRRVGRRAVALDAVPAGPVDMEDVGRVEIGRRAVFVADLV